MRLDSDTAPALCTREKNKRGISMVAIERGTIGMKAAWERS